MLKKSIISIFLFITSSIAIAEIRPFVNADVGYVDTDYDDGIYFDVGGGLQFNDNFELEIAYNHYGEILPFDVDVTSFSVGLNVGGYVSESIRLFGILGVERLEADETISIAGYSVSIDESSTEAFFGIGAAFHQGENLAIRTKLVSHDSGDILTANIGLVFYF